MRAVLLPYLGLGVMACAASAPPPQAPAVANAAVEAPPCVAVAERLSTAMSEGLRADAVSLPDGFKDDFARVLSSVCHDDGWSEETRACFVAAREETDIVACEATWSPEMAASVERRSFAFLDGHVVDGGVEGLDDGMPPPPPPPPPRRGHVAAPQALESLRLTPVRIVADAATKTEMVERGLERLSFSAQLCVDPTGSVTRVKPLKGSGISGFDQDVINEMQTWRYRPFVLDGQPAPVCTGVNINYKLAPPSP